MLATKPAFTGLKGQDVPDKIQVFSEEVIKLDQMGDLQQLQIKGDISGSLQMAQLCSSGMDKLTGFSAPTQGASGNRRETATMGSIMDSRATIRMNLKNLNLEFIGLNELYDMLLTLCNDFMRPETLFKLIGDYAKFYNPERKDKFKPVTQAIESEYNKSNKVKMLDSLIGKITPLASINPKTFTILNALLGMQLEAMGSEFTAFKRFLFEEDPKQIALWMLVNKQGTNKPSPGISPMPSSPVAGAVSNQQGIPMSGQEMQTRGI